MANHGQTSYSIISTSSASAMPVRLTITKLMSAAKQGNLDAIRTSLETYGLPANGSKTTDYTVLQAVLQRSYKEIAKLLIQHNCHVNNPTDNADKQSTPLYLAVSLKDDDLVYMLLQKGAIIDIKDHRSGQSPVHLATVNRSVNILWKLLHFNTNVNFCDTAGKTALQILLEQAVYHRKSSSETVNSKLVRKFMECKASLNCRGGPHDQSPLHLAALLPQRDILEILLPYSADLNHCDSQGNTVLHCLLSTKYACHGTDQEKTNLEIVNAMLTRGARHDSVNKFGQVPAHLAAKNRHLSVLPLLLQYERCINRVDHEGKTILHRLIEDFQAIDASLLEKYKQTMKIIVEKGGRGDYKSTAADTAMHLAAQNSEKDPNVLGIILQGMSVDVNTKDKSGKTILHMIAALPTPNLHLVKFLMSKGLKVDIKDDKTGMTSIQIAAKNNNMALLSEFLPYITDVNAVDLQGGDTMMHHLLKARDNQKLVEILLQKGASIDLKNKRGIAPTFFAAETMSMSFLLTLLRLSQDLSGQALMRDSMTNRTLLHLILDMPSFDADGCEVLRILLLSGALIDQRDSSDNMPLHKKLLFNQPDLIDVIVSNVTKTNLCGNEGRTLILFLGKLTPERIQTSEAEVIKLTKMLLGCGVLVEGTNNRGQNVLDLACRSKELLRIILMYGQNVTAIKDRKGNTVLHTHLMDKAENRNIGTVKLLIEKGISVESQNDEDETPLHLAAKNSELKILKLLLENVQDVNVKDKRGNDVLHVLLSSKVIPPQTESTSKISTTTETDKDILDFIGQLFQKGLKMNAVNNAGETHLHVACNSFQLNACRYLLQCGAEPQICDKLGNSSLHFMAQAKTDDFIGMTTTMYEQEMVWYLMSRGCGPNDKNYVGRTALHIAAKNGRTHVVEALVTSGADINCADTVSGASPLHLAAASRHVNIIRILAMVGADINARQSDGSSVLQLVLHNPLKEDDIDDGLVSHLLELGADPEQRDNYGKTALHWACWNEDKHGFQALLDHGASLDVEDNEGFPPLHYATREKVRTSAVLHLTKLRAAGMTISEKNKKFMKELTDKLDLKEVIQSMNYESEVHVLRQVLIDSKSSLYDLLSKDVNSLSYYENNPVLQDLVNSEDFITSFPHYGHLIKSCVHMGKIRKELLTAATDSLSHLAGSLVPLTCSIKIFDPSFNNESLRCLIKAGKNVRTSRKRRSSCSEEEERLTKHPRRLSV